MVGTYWPTATFNLALAEQFTRSGWRQVPVGHSSFDGVAAVADDDAWAVGEAIYHWDGSAWTLVAGLGG